MTTEVLVALIVLGLNLLVLEVLVVMMVVTLNREGHFQKREGR